MLQLIKNTPDYLRDAAQIPARALAALRYMFAPFEELQLPVSNEEHSNIVPRETSEKYMSFTFALISLSAHVARANGQVSRAQYLAFRDSFPLSGGVCGKIRQLFAIACQSDTPYTQHVQHIKQLFPGQKDLFISLVDKLFAVATADHKPLSLPEERLLARIAKQLDISPADYSALYDKYSRPLAPHHVLGVRKREKRGIIKQRYYKLMQRYHPDRYASEATSPEVMMLLTLKTSEISAAYNALARRAA